MNNALGFLSSFYNSSSSNNSYNPIGNSLMMEIPQESYNFNLTLKLNKSMFVPSFLLKKTLKYLEDLYYVIPKDEPLTLTRLLFKNANTRRILAPLIRKNTTLSGYLQFINNIDEFRDNKDNEYFTTNGCLFDKDYNIILCCGYNVQFKSTTFEDGVTKINNIIVTHPVIYINPLVLKGDNSVYKAIMLQIVQATYLGLKGDYVIERFANISIFIGTMYGMEVENNSLLKNIELRFENITPKYITKNRELGITDL